MRATYSWCTADAPMTCGTPCNCPFTRTVTKTCDTKQCRLSVLVMWFSMLQQMK